MQTRCLTPLSFVFAHSLRAIIQTPFTQYIIAGSLRPIEFHRFLQADIYYLQNYSKILKSLAFKMEKSSERELMLQFSESTSREWRFHQEFLSQYPNPTTTYHPPHFLRENIRHLETCAQHSAAVGTAAMVPCPVIYSQLFQHIKSHAISIETHPLKEWLINQFEPSSMAQKIIPMVQDMAKETSPRVQAHMLNAANRAAFYETRFYANVTAAAKRTHHSSRFFHLASTHHPTVDLTSRSNTFYFTR